MPPKTALTQIRLDSIVACLTPILSLLNDISDAFGTPFIPAIAKTTLSLMTLAQVIYNYHNLGSQFYPLLQNVKKNKDECIQLMEEIHELLYAIINIHIKSGTGSTLPPATLSAFGELREVFVFMEAQQDGNKIKDFFHQSEKKILLNECRAGLQKAINMFKMEGAMNMHGNIDKMRKETERIHQELLESISNSSDISERSSSIHHWADDLLNSSNSISMLPAKPKIFHGRESELEHIVEILHHEPARIAILGPGGMGKTSLAKAALHHPDIIFKYQHRFFVAADSATTNIELAALIGLHMGLKPGKDLTKPVAHYFSNKGPSLLVIDNLETPWERMESRGGVEEFLSRLTDVAHLALMASTQQIITMRGAERPAKVRWTRPFLQPLEPLSDAAARETFVTIAEDFHDSKDITQLLSWTNNLPLAVDLIAHLVDHEGCENVLARWETEKTSLLSDGHDQRSNLDMSIAISLSSPRLSSGAKELLSLLSILPDGLSDAELLQSKLSIKKILECRSILLRTSLAYEDGRKRLKSLVPIQEHMQQFYPAPPLLIHQVEKHFHLLLAVYANHAGSQQVAGHPNQIISNLGNLHQVLLCGLQQENPTLAETINCVILLNRFTRVAGYGRHVLMNHIPAALSSIRDDRLEATFIIEVFHSRLFHPIDNPEQLIDQAAYHFGKFNDLLLEIRFYCAVADYSFQIQGNRLRANQFLDKALMLSQTCGNKKQQALVLTGRALMQFSIGEYCEAQIHAREAQRLSQLSADLQHESYALRIEAMCSTDLGDYKNSMFLFHRARRLLELCGMAQGAINDSIMTSEAETHLLKSEYVEARSIHVKRVQNAQDTHSYAFSLLNLAVIDIIIGANPQDVHQNLSKAREIFTTGSLRSLNYCDITLGKLHLRESQTHTAKLIFEKLLKSGIKNNFQAALACLESLADTSQWPTCDFEWASRWTVVYLVNAKGKQNKRALHKALQFLGDVFLTEGDLNTACSLFTVALETFTYMDIHHSRAQCMLRLGDIYEKKGHSVEAVEFWQQARPFFERALQAKGMTEIDTRLIAVNQEISDRYDVEIKELIWTSHLKLANTNSV
ncbi:hypothetical protein C8R44DRAFT_849434 [Mycena epipterygia]|nr:hypothetical protein C8R44DRAFT_849434 [Mycena epipterygia]